MITRIILTLLAGVALLFGTAACGEDLDASADTTDVVAGFYPLAFAAEQIGGDRVDVTNLTPAGAEPHDLELTPREVEGILDADLVLYLGDGFQPAVEEAAAESNGEAIDVLDGLELRNDDPHVWRSEERRVGKECCSQSRWRGWRYP